MSIDTYFDVVVVYFTVHSKILKDKLKIRSMSEKKKRKKVHVEYKEEYSESIIRGWMMGKPVVGEAVFDDKNEDVFEPRPSRYVTISSASRRFFLLTFEQQQTWLGCEIRESC